MNNTIHPADGGNAWGKGKQPVVPEPSAYGAAFLVLVLAIVIVRRVDMLRKL
jgi:hypothetical protein